MLAEVRQRRREAGQVGGAVDFDRPAVQVRGLLGRGQGFLPLPQRRQQGAEVGQRHREIRQVGGVGFGQPPVQVGGLPAGGQGLVATAGVGQAPGEDRVQAGSVGGIGGGGEAVVGENGGDGRGGNVPLDVAVGGQQRLDGL